MPAVNDGKASMGYMLQPVHTRPGAALNILDLSQWYPLYYNQLEDKVSG
jgi:hypothetical protein